MTVALRPAVLPFESAVNVATPLPLAEPDSVSHDAPPEEDQEQPAVVVTVAFTVPPVFEKFTDVGDTLKAQGTGAAA